jgi:hypothetical protein
MPDQKVEIKEEEEMICSDLVEAFTHIHKTLGLTAVFEDRDPSVFTHTYLSCKFIETSTGFVCVPVSYTKLYHNKNPKSIFTNRSETEALSMLYYMKAMNPVWNCTPLGLAFKGMYVNKLEGVKLSARSKRQIQAMMYNEYSVVGSLQDVTCQVTRDEEIRDLERRGIDTSFYHTTLATLPILSDNCLLDSTMLEEMAKQHYGHVVRKEWPAAYAPTLTEPLINDLHGLVRSIFEN